MKRTGKQIICDAWNYIKMDLKNNRIAIIAILLYFVFAKVVLHGFCPMVLLTGLPCPACGLTRAGIALLTGHFAKAWAYHPFIYVFVVFVVLFGVQRYVYRKTFRWMKPLVIIALLALVGFYLYRMMMFFPGEPPISYFRHNLIALLYHLFTGR